MDIDNRFVLPADVQLIPVATLPPETRSKFESEDTDVAVMRPGSRTAVKLIDEDSAALLQLFRKPRTIVEAVFSFASDRQLNAEEVLKDSYPVLRRFIENRLLLDPTTDSSGAIRASFAPGDMLDKYRIERVIQVLEDSELYKASDPSGAAVAVKLARPKYEDHVRPLFQREAYVLQHLDRCVSPGFLGEGELEGRPYLAMEWLEARTLSTCLSRLAPAHASPAKRFAACTAVARAYAELHDRRVVHGDVHPRNVMLTESLDRAWILDFGLAYVDGAPDSFGRARRGGVSYYFEPEYASRHLAKRRAPKASFASDQYALAAMLYLVYCGELYLNFAADREELFKQIAEQAPVPFATRGVPDWPELESTLQRALAKRTKHRFPSVRSMTDELDRLTVPTPPSPTRTLPAVEHSAAGKTATRDALRRLAEEFETGLAACELEAWEAVPAPYPRCSVTFGAAGIAYWLYRLAALRKDSGLLFTADGVINIARIMAKRQDAFVSQDGELTEQVVGPVSVYHTMSGIHCVQALISHAMGDLVSQGSATSAFVASATGPCENLDLTLGASSALVGGAMLLGAMPDSSIISPAELVPRVDVVMDRIWEQLNRMPMCDRAEQVRFSGIAHGWAGFLYSTLMWCDASGREVPRYVRDRAVELGEAGVIVGDKVMWPRRFAPEGRSQQSQFLSSWCNGSAGFVFLWTLADRLIGDPRYQIWSRHAALHCLEDGVGSPDLCCGVGGKAYALLAMFKHTQDEMWLDAAYTVLGKFNFASLRGYLKRDALYKGPLGLCLLAYELESPNNAVMPMFERENWSSVPRRKDLRPAPAQPARGKPA
ncbi:MAG: protein kinase domain-containing protein [Phycisphaerales bacterium]